MMIMKTSKYDHLIHPNVIVHRINIVSYLLIHMIYEKITLVNDQETANVLEKNHKHVEDNVKMLSGNQVMENGYQSDENLRYHHNDLNQHDFKEIEEKQMSNY